MTDRDRGTRPGDLPSIPRGATIGVDTEGTGLDWTRDHAFGFSLALSDKDWYIDLREHPRATGLLQEWLERAGVAVAHNAKYDMHMIANLGVEFDPRKFDCTMMRAALIDANHLSYALDDLAEIYLGRKKIKLAEILGLNVSEKKIKKNMVDVPLWAMNKYASLDARLCLDLWEWQRAEIAEQGIEEVVDFEKELMPWIWMMERRGVRVDIEAAERASEEIDVQVKEAKKQLKDLAGFEVNPNPSGSIHKLFEPKEITSGPNKGSFKLICGTIVPPTPKGKASIGKDQLEESPHPAANLILSTREMMKAKDTFLKAHIIDRHSNNRVHPSINSTKTDRGTGTYTGRFSYSEPALQQIPKRNKKIQEIVKKIFLPEEGQEWMTFDLDQIDYRCFAHFVNDPNTIEAYRKNPKLDMHAWVASVTGLPRAPERSGGPNAKQLNLSVVFCAGNGKVARMMGMDTYWEEKDYGNGKFMMEMPCEEAQAIIDLYHNTIPGVRSMQKRAKDTAKNRGYIETFKGRRIRFYKGYGAHKASGLLYQSTAAEINKVIHLRLFQRLDWETARLMLGVHDSFEVSHDPAVRREIADICCEAVEDFPHMRVPVTADFQVGKNWYEAVIGSKIDVNTRYPKS